MNISQLNIPKTCSEMQQLCETYYQQFYLELVRIPNLSLNSYVDNLLLLIEDLCKNTVSRPEVIRAAIGIVALHRFGYPDFGRLSKLFDRLLPQSDIEYVKFTSWCAGRLIHHPHIKQGIYVRHLFERLIGWIRAVGRRSRPLAAAHLLAALSTNAGSSVVVYISTLQSIIWTLVSHQSTLVLKGTAEAISKFTRAVVRYGSSELNSYLDFFTKLCIKLLDSNSIPKNYTALILLQQLIIQCPDYFLQPIQHFYSRLMDLDDNIPLLLKVAQFSTISSLSLVDPNAFVDNIADEYFDNVQSIIYEFPKETVDSLLLLIKTIPGFIESKLDDIKAFSKALVNDSDSDFALLTGILNKFKEKCLPLNEDLLKQLINAPITQNYLQFFVAMASTTKDIEQSKSAEKASLSNIFALLIDRIKKELKTSHTNIVLNLLAELPPEFIFDHNELLKDVMDLALLSSSDDTRSIAPKAIFNIAKANDKINMTEIASKLFHLAMYDKSSCVRSAIIKTIHQNCRELFASQEFLKASKIFINDDSITVRRQIFSILADIMNLNPLNITPLVRDAILNCFFYLRYSPNIRQQARYMETLPDIIRACAPIIKAYSGTIMDIALLSLTSFCETPNVKYENFMEEDSVIITLTAVVDSLSLLAPLDPKIVAHYNDIFIPLLCKILLTVDRRQLALSILNFFLTILTSPSYDTSYRIKTPMLLSACSKFLSNTHSRKAKMATLKVLGAIGVLEVNQKPAPTFCQSPENVDEKLAREFFHPGKDLENVIDDSLLLEKDTAEQYFAPFTASALLSLFKDDNMKEYYVEIVQALVQVVKSPKSYLLVYFDSFVSRLLEVMERSTDEEMKEFLPLFSQVVETSTINSAPFLKRSLELIHSRFTTELRLPFLDLILSFLYSLRDQFAIYSPQITQLLVRCLDENKTTDEHVSNSVLTIFTVLSVYIIELLYIIIPYVCNIFLSEQTLRNVRIASLETLTKISQQVDLYDYLGPIIRAITVGIYDDTDKTGKMKSASYELLYSLLETQGPNFLESAESLFESLNKSNLITEQLSQLITKAKQLPKPFKFKPVALANSNFNNQNKSKLIYKNYQFCEDGIVLKIHTPTIGSDKYMEQWLRSLILAVISNSPSNSIRACTTLATSYSPLAMKLLNAAFLSCWMETSENGKRTIALSIKELLTAGNNFESVIKEILEILIFMDKIEQPLPIEPQSIVTACLRYGYTAYALRIQQGLYDNNPNDPRVICQLINIYIQLQNWPDATGLWKNCQSKLLNTTLNDPQILTRLRFWEQVEPIFEARFNRMKDFESFYGLSQSLSSMANWNELMQYTNVFKTLLLPHQKRDVSIFFAEAAFHTGKWDLFDEFLKYLPDISARGMALKALNAIHKNDMKAADESITAGFSLLASRPLTFWANKQRVHPETMQQAQELVEIIDIKNWFSNTMDRDRIREVWKERLLTAPQEFDIWFRLVANRIQIIDIRDNNLFRLFAMKSALGNKIHANAFNVLFPDFNFDTSPDLYKICYAVAHWNGGETQRALNEMKKLTTIVTDDDLSLRCHYTYSAWLLEGADNDSKEVLTEVYKHLKIVNEKSKTQISTNENQRQFPAMSFDLNSPEIIKKIQQATECCGSLTLPSTILKGLTINQTRLELLEKWSDVNASMISFDPDHIEEYVNNAINALMMSIDLSSSFPDVVQFLNLFFEHAKKDEIFNSTHEFIRQMKPKLLIQAAPQLLIQLSHPCQKVAAFVKDIILALLKEHYHELIFSVIGTKYSTNRSRANEAKRILDMFATYNPEVYNEVKLIRKSMLMAAVTWSERVLQLIADAGGCYRSHDEAKLIFILSSIVKLTSKPKCGMHNLFLKHYASKIRNLNQILSTFKKNNKHCMNDIYKWCKEMQLILSEELNKIRMIQLSSISKELAEKTDFLIAVPGTYKPFKPVNHIKYFVGQLQVYMTKQQPKDVVVRGEDGKFYQYLLKGHEDLRLDERIMQFFRLINSLIMKQSVFHRNIIQTMGVIPLSVQHGLVQWIPGAETLRTIVEDQRKIHHQDPMIEYKMLNDVFNTQYDLLQPIQKYQIIKKIFRTVPDTDLANFLWLKSKGAESWMKQTRTFAISCGMTSIVGYIIGLGDRHPSNLLIDSCTGKVIHIDFGDCFERTTRRKLWPEVVPFRLTRMMVKAMGPTGVDGNFRNSFVNMSQLARENKRVLVMVLSTFVHEPLVDPNYSIEDGESSSENIIQSKSEESIAQKEKDNVIQTNVEMRKRVIQKLTGNDFGENEKLSVEDQATLLIKTASDPYVLSKMFSGWCPFW